MSPATGRERTIDEQEPYDDDRTNPPRPRLTIRRILKWLLTGVVVVGVFEALIGRSAVTMTFAAVLFLGGACSALRIAAQIWDGYYRRDLASIGDPKLRHAWKRLNQNMAAVMVITGLWIAGAIALWCNPSAPFLCKALGELALLGAFSVFVATVSFWVDEVNELSPPKADGGKRLRSGTRIILDTRLGDFVLRIGKRELCNKAADGAAASPSAAAPQNEPAPEARGARAAVGRWINKTFIEPRPGRSGAAVSVLAFVLVFVLAADISAHIGRERDRIKRGIEERLGDLGDAWDKFSSDRDSGPEAGGLETKTDETNSGERAQAPQDLPELPGDPGTATDADQCESVGDAGTGAPVRQRSDLFALWHGRDKAQGLEPVDSFSWLIAGCPPGRAQQVTGHPGVWYEPGYCGDLRGLGLAFETGSPVMLLQQAARFGMEQAEAGALRGASLRMGIGSGDFHVIDVDTAAGKGSYTLIRETNSGGVRPNGPAADSDCQKLSDENAAYTVVPPGALPLWRLVVERLGWAWPDDDGSHFPDGRKLVFRTGGETGARILARAHCESAVACTLWLDGQRYTSGPGPLTTSPAEITDLHTRPAVAPMP